MPIDPSRAVGAAYPTVHTSWEERDVLLYHLSIGAGLEHPEEPNELRYAYEGDLQVLPTFVAVPVYEVAFDINSLPGVDIDLTMVLHGEQQIEVHRPLPTSAEVTCTARLADVYDKGKAAVLVIETLVADAGGKPIVTSRSLAFARGEGGFGGEPGPPATGAPPQRPADARLRVPTARNQALLFRLNGDWNPLHADPAIAALGGFDRPILHGQCSYGAVLRAVVDAELSGDATAVRSYTTRFSGVVYPGEVLLTDVWREPGRLVLSTSAEGRDQPVLTQSVVEHT